MIKLIGQRVALSCATLLIVSAIIFVSTEVLPGDVATAILGREASPARLAALREQLGLDRPALERYVEWLSGALRGDFGTSLARPNVAVGQLIAERLRNTVLLSISAAVIGLPLALGLGILAGLLRDRTPDVVISSLALIGMSLPEFVIGSLLILTFGVSWAILPAVTVAPPDAPITALLPNLILPAITLIIVMVAYILRMVRSSMIDAMASDYVQMATLKGMSRTRVVLRHALPNALLPTINAVALTVAWLIGGVVVVETVFNFPGIGRLMVTAVQDRDLPLVQALGLLGATLYITINLSADLLTLWLSPRLRARVV
ncbi:MAG: ABC transporter permease [Chloroflexaceae bacterium]|nr:ABC transporter permease [Chloroflexaceae bacterium]